jgi:hypothetical protein
MTFLCRSHRQSPTTCTLSVSITSNKVRVHRKFGSTYADPFHRLHSRVHTFFVYNGLPQTPTPSSRNSWGKAGRNAGQIGVTYCEADWNRIRMRQEAARSRALCIKVSLLLRVCPRSLASLTVETSHDHANWGRRNRKGARRFVVARFARDECSCMVGWYVQLRFKVTWASIQQA